MCRLSVCLSYWWGLTAVNAKRFDITKEVGNDGGLKWLVEVGALNSGQVVPGVYVAASMTFLIQEVQTTSNPNKDVRDLIYLLYIQTVYSVSVKNNR